jgi:hypothetical protein
MMIAPTSLTILERTGMQPWEARQAVDALCFLVVEETERRGVSDAELVDRFGYIAGQAVVRLRKYWRDNGHGKRRRRGGR